MSDNRDVVINITNNIDVESDTSTEVNSARSSIKNFCIKIFNSDLFEYFCYLIAFVSGGGIASLSVISLFKD